MNCGPRHRFVVRAAGGVGPAFIVHNCTQAASRDVMACNMPFVEAEGFEIVGTVHDEIIPEVPDTPEFSAGRLERAMGHVPPWAEGLPLSVKAYETYRYKKD